MSQSPSTPAARWRLPAIILLYLILAVLFALYTPAWQAPDEPAHYNYVRYLAEQHRFPVLKPGDYPAAYLEEIKAAHFPPTMSIDPLRYEYHQPPLYYLLAVPVYQLFGGALLPLRLFSVVIGALLLLVVYWAVQELAPRHPGLALGAAAWVAFLPMHLAQSAAAGNDLLAELLLAAILLLTIRYLKAVGQAGPLRVSHTENRMLVILGITTGLALITKSSAYVALPLVLLAILARRLWLDDRPLSASALLRSAGFYLLPAVALALPWWVRNAALYGGTDLLGLNRHTQVVAGQLRTAEYLAAHGVVQWLRDAGLTTFHSFWGQFGWMGVLIDQRLYQALAIFSALALAGLVAWAAGAWRRWAGESAWRPARWQMIAAGLLVLSVLFSLASYLWYNTQFVQFQGRYLFPALLAIGLGVALGWREALRRDRARLLAVVLFTGAAALGFAGLLRRDFTTWPLLMLLAAAAAFAVRSILPRRWDPLVYPLPYLALIPLDLACLFLFIVPQLAL